MYSETCGSLIASHEQWNVCWRSFPTNVYLNLSATLFETMKCVALRTRSTNILPYLAFFLSNSIRQQKMLCSLTCFPLTKASQQHRIEKRVRLHLTNVQYFKLSLLGNYFCTQSVVHCAMPICPLWQTQTETRPVLSDIHPPPCILLTALSLYPSKTLKSKYNTMLTLTNKQPGLWKNGPMDARVTNFSLES